MENALQGLGTLSFNDIEPIPVASKAKSKMAQQQHEARLAFEAFDFSCFGTFESQGSWSWRESMGTCEKGSITAFILEPGQEDTTAFVFECVWRNGSMMSTSVFRK